MDNYLDTLVGFTSTRRFEELPESTVIAAKDVVMDTIGAIVAGNRLPENVAFGDLIAGRSAPGAAAILGRPHRVDPMMAALVNATSGVSLEMDEGNRFGAGHPSIHAMPGALAVAEEMGASGRRFIEAFVVGYEVETRIGRATRIRPGVHSHGHWGAPATAAAIARLKGYDVEQTKAVINIAASMSPANTWTPCFEGATVRNLYPGRSGMQGILAAHLHESGFTGVADGMADVYGTVIGDQFDTEAVVEALGAPYRIEQNYFKFHACCRINHPVLDAVLEAQGGEALNPAEIEAVEVYSARRLQDTHLAGMVGDYPRNMLSAKFNLPYAVAAVLVRGNADITAFLPEAVADPRIERLAGRVRVEADPSLASGREPGDRPTARAVIRLSDARELRGEIAVVRGDWENRAPREELEAKFRFITEGVITPSQADQVLEAVARLERLDDVRELTDAVSA